MKKHPSNPIRNLLFAAACASSLACWAIPAHAASPPSTEPASLAELFEQGVYNEETKGDVDAAIAVYRRLLADSKIQEALAAHAQFRLAQCYLKSNQNDAAQAEMEKLVKDYPGESARLI